MALGRTSARTVSLSSPSPQDIASAEWRAANPMQGATSWTSSRPLGMRPDRRSDHGVASWFHARRGISSTNKVRPQPHSRPFVNFDIQAGAGSQEFRSLPRVCRNHEACATGVRHGNGQSIPSWSSNRPEMPTSSCLRCSADYHVVVGGLGGPNRTGARERRRRIVDGDEGQRHAGQHGPVAAV